MVDINNLFNKAKEAFDKKNYDYAAEAARNLLEIKPDHAPARQLLRTSIFRKYEATGKIPSGPIAALSACLPMLKMGVLGMVSRKSPGMINACEDYLAKNPASVWARYKLAGIFDEMKYTDSAIQEYEGIVDISPDHLDSLRALGEIYRQRQDVIKATEYYKKILSLVPADRETSKALKDLAAMSTMEKGGWSAAKSVRDVIHDKSKAAELEKSSQFTKATEIDAEIARLTATMQENNPQSTPTLRKIGELYIVKKDFKSAELIYQKISKLNPAEASINMRLGDIKIMVFDADINRLQKELVANPNNKDLQAKIIGLKSERSKFKVEEFRRRVQAYPTDMHMHFLLGGALYAAGQIDEAIAELQNSVRDPKHRLESYRCLGEAFSKKDMYDLAVEQFKKALASSSLSTEQTKELRYLLAKAYEGNKNYKESMTEYKSILEVDFSYKDVAKKVEQLAALVKG